MNTLIIVGITFGFYFILFLLTRMKKNKTIQRRAAERQDITSVNDNFRTAFGGDKYILDFANEKYNKDNKPSKRGDPLLFESYAPAKPEKSNRGSLLITLLFLDSPLIWALFPSIRHSIRDYLNRD